MSKRFEFISVGAALLATAVLAAARPAGVGSTDYLHASGGRSLGDVLIVESGQITLSADGVGMTGPTGLIQVDKPSASATVRSAYLATASQGFSNAVIADGCVTLAGSGVSWDMIVAGPINNNNHWADVTDIVAPVIDVAPAGINDLVVTECGSIDGSALYVIFDDPDTDLVQTAVIAFGGQSTLGDDFSIGFGAPVEIDANTVIELGLAISFGAQGQDPCQNSQVDINGQRLTSDAGHTDDGEFANGALITVGGIGDDRANPLDPFEGDPCVPFAVGTDDELYDVTPFINNGDTSMLVHTVNPSGDDNIFAAHMLITFAVVVNEGAVLTPGLANRTVGSMHTLTATLQDDNGDPVVGRDVEIDILAGPNTGLGSGVLVTNGAGQVSFSYSSAIVGMDQARASFLDSNGDPALSNIALVFWDRPASANDLPGTFSLGQNYPNPFNPSTTIEFSLPETGIASLVVRNLAGQTVATLFEGMAPAGSHSVVFDASNLSSGVYYYTLEQGSLRASNKLVLMK
ncbi:MAG: T9SS type A sorting domain-containing protein [Candidatus Cloacimonetes bacterium]|nr:T9SS type A sorting domain-containing protein [Candidatus Cloacimonadota bacterium]